MKKVIFSIVVLSFTFLMSCSKEDDAQLTNTDNNSTSVDFSAMDLSTDVTNYLDDFYDQDYVEGDDVSISSDGVDYQIVEIIVGNDNRARGYVALNGSGQFMYFFDVDRDDFISTAHDIGGGSIIVSENINDQAEYDETNGYDVLDYLGDGDDDDNYPGRVFWGKETVRYKDDCDTPGLNYKRPIEQQYVFWIKVGKPTLGDPVPC